jgi:hypothetical protein
MRFRTSSERFPQKEHFSRHSTGAQIRTAQRMTRLQKTSIMLVSDMIVLA